MLTSLKQLVRVEEDEKKAERERGAYPSTAVIRTCGVQISRLHGLIKRVVQPPVSVVCFVWPRLVYADE